MYKITLLISILSYLFVDKTYVCNHNHDKDLTKFLLNTRNVCSILLYYKIGQGTFNLYLDDGGIVRVCLIEFCIPLCVVTLSNEALAAGVVALILVWLAIGLTVSNICHSFQKILRNLLQLKRQHGVSAFARLTDADTLWLFLNSWCLSVWKQMFVYICEHECVRVTCVYSSLF